MEVKTCFVKNILRLSLIFKTVVSKISKQTRLKGLSNFEHNFAIFNVNASFFKILHSHVYAYFKTQWRLQTSIEV